jgi:hypothetical protein
MPIGRVTLNMAIIFDTELLIVYQSQEIFACATRPSSGEKSDIWYPRDTEKPAETLEGPRYRLLGSDH